MTSSLITFWHALPSGFTALVFVDANRFFCSVFCCAVCCGGHGGIFKMVNSILSFPSSPSFLLGRFSFFSRDKKRMQASQKNVHFQDTFREWSNSNKDDTYTEQGQEALQHLWLKAWASCRTSQQSSNKKLLWTDLAVHGLYLPCKLQWLCSRWTPQKGSLTVYLVTAENGIQAL